MNIKTVFLTILLKPDCYKYQKPGIIGRNFHYRLCNMTASFFSYPYPLLQDTTHDIAFEAELLKRV